MGSAYRWLCAPFSESSSAVSLMALSSLRLPKEPRGLPARCVSCEIH